MKAFELSETFKTIIEADTAFAGISLQVAQSEEPVVHPRIVFELEPRPLGGSANYLTFQLTMIVYSEADDAEAHAARVELLRRKFFGATQEHSETARAAIKTAVNAGGLFELLGRGHDAPADVAAAGVEGAHFKSEVRIAGTVKVLDTE